MGWRQTALLKEPQLHYLIRRPILLSSGCGVRPGHQRCPAASPATLWVARARPLCYELRPRRAPHAPLKRRPRRGRRFCESRYSLSTYNSSPPAESSNELRRVAALRLPGGAADCATRWVARTPPPAPPKSAKFGLSPIPPRGAPRLGDRAGGSATRTILPPNSPPHSQKFVLGTPPPHR